MKKKGSITYVYVALFLSAILIILIGNSYFLTDRTRSNLIEIYWKQAELMVKTIAFSAQHSIESVSLTPQQIRRHLKETVTRIELLDSPDDPLTREKLDEIVQLENLETVTIFGDHGKTYLSSGKRDLSGSDRPDHKTIIFDRSAQKGAIVITVSPSKLMEIKISIGLKLLIASLESHNIIQSITFIDEEFKVVADSDPYRVGITEEELEYLDAFNSNASYFHRDSDNDIMKVIHPLKFSPSRRGVLKIVYPINRIDVIYENTFKNTVLNSSVVMLLAILAAIIAVILNKRNLVKIEAMEKKIRENEKLASLTNLTAGVAHEVRNPLNAVSIVIQRLQWEFTPKNEEDLEEYQSLTDLMRRQVDRINLIINDFIDFAKPFEPKKHSFRINEFIENCLELVRPEASEKGINLLTNISTEEVSFLGDNEKLTQVLINILRNALDASEQYDTITIDSKVTKENQWLLQVKDNGVGIPKENLSHIFDMYFTTKKTGTGLGLYICRKIIHAHKGVIELHPNMGSGITVSISLPFLDF